MKYYLCSRHKSLIDHAEGFKKVFPYEHTAADTSNLIMLDQSLWKH